MTTSKAGDRALTIPKVVLYLLILAYAMNFADRTIINTLGEAIKQELGLSDLQLGLLGGLSFALLYSVMGIVVARFSDRHNRVKILSGAIFFWSLATMICGAATNYISLLLMRIGVGVGESGCSPPAQSLIADYFPPQKRATAISLYYVGVPLGILIGALAAGFLAQEFGWRTAFVVVGAPGVLLAIIVWLLLKEPPRGRFDAPQLDDETPSLSAVIKIMWSTPVLRHIVTGSTLATFASYAIAQFLHPLFVRAFDLSYSHAALIFGLLTAASAGIGAPLGGYLADALSKRDVRWLCWVPAIGLVAATPFYLAGMFQPNWMVLAAFLFLPGIATYLYHGPTFAALHNSLTSRMRATATSIVLFLSAAIGLGLGPLLAGLVSDMVAQATYTGPGAFSDVCRGATSAIDFGAQTACREASGGGVRVAIVTASLVFVWAGIHYFIAARKMKS